MPREDVYPGSPEEWMRFARSDLVLAKEGRLPGVLLDGLCFHAQQAAEKAIKAVLVRRKVRFPKTHNLRALLDLLPESNSVPKTIDAATVLTAYAIVTRYPGGFENITPQTHRRAVRMAAAVVRWAERLAR